MMVLELQVATNAVVAVNDEVVVVEKVTLVVPADTVTTLGRSANAARLVDPIATPWSLLGGEFSVTVTKTC